MKRALWCDIQKAKIPQEVVSERYDIVFWGSDCCERLIPTFSELRSVYHQAMDLGLQMGLKTPVISEFVLNDYCELVRQIIEANMKIFITVNDWGLLNYLTEHRQDCVTVIIGRFLTRQKTDPLTEHIRAQIPEEVYKHFCTPTLLNQFFVDYAYHNDIHFFEIDNVKSTIDLPVLMHPYEIMLSYPYVMTALTRYCPYYQINEPYLRIRMCSAECRNNCLSISSCVQGEYCYKENAIAYINSVLPDNIPISILLDEEGR